MHEYRVQPFYNEERKFRDGGASTWVVALQLVIAAADVWLGNTKDIKEAIEKIQFEIAKLWNAIELLGDALEKVHAELSAKILEVEYKNIAGEVLGLSEAMKLLAETKDQSNIADAFIDAQINQSKIVARLNEALKPEDAVRYLAYLDLLVINSGFRLAAIMAIEGLSIDKKSENLAEQITIVNSHVDYALEQLTNLFRSKYIISSVGFLHDCYPENASKPGKKEPFKGTPSCQQDWGYYYEGGNGVPIVTITLQGGAEPFASAANNAKKKQAQEKVSQIVEEEATSKAKAKWESDYEKLIMKLPS